MEWRLCHGLGLHFSQWCRRVSNSPSLHAVSIEDIESVRKGRQSEGLKKYTDASDEHRCFSIFFKGRMKNLDLMANSEDELNKWVTSLEKLINNMHNLSHQKKQEQYP